MKHYLNINQMKEIGLTEGAKVDAHAISLVSGKFLICGTKTVKGYCTGCNDMIILSDNKKYHVWKTINNDTALQAVTSSKKRYYLNY